MKVSSAFRPASASVASTVKKDASSVMVTGAVGALRMTGGVVIHIYNSYSEQHLVT